MMIPTSKEREAIRQAAMKAKREHIEQHTPHDTIIKLVDALHQAMSVVEMKQTVIESTQKLADRFKGDVKALEKLLCENCVAQYEAEKKLKAL